MHEQAQGGFVHPLALGEGERFANKASETLTSGVVPAFDVAGLARAFAAGAVGCAGERSPRRPATNRRGWPGSGSRVGCARAERGHFGPNDPRQSRRLPGGFADRGRSTPSGHWPSNRRNSRVHPTGNRLAGHAEDALGRPQAQSLDFHGPQDQRLALGIGGRTLGYQHPVCSTRLAEILLGARGVVAAFDNGCAGARRTAGNRRFHAHSSPKKSALSLAQLPLPALAQVCYVVLRPLTGQAAAFTLPTIYEFSTGLLERLWGAWQQGQSQSAETSPGHPTRPMSRDKYVDHQE